MRPQPEPDQTAVRPILRHGADTGAVLITLIESLRRHLQNGLILHYRSDNPAGFKAKLAELRREITQLQYVANRLEQANLDNYDSRGPFGDIRVLSDKVEAELISLHGWTLSLVESLFTLVRIERGSDEVTALRNEWRRFF